MELILAFTGVAVLVLGMIVLKVLGMKKRRLSSTAQQKILRNWQHAASLEDDYRRILELDKVLDQLLEELGYSGSVADKLKKAEAFVPNINAVWTAHKLRNRIAHEPGAELGSREVQSAVNAFEAVFRKFLQ